MKEGESPTGRFDSGVRCGGGTHRFLALATAPVHYCADCGLCRDMWGVEIDWSPDMEKAPVEVLKVMRALKRGWSTLDG